MIKPLLVLTLAAALSSPVRADLLLQPNDHLAICGDSITEQKKYSVFMEDYLLMCAPVDGLRITQFGWSGEKAGGFLDRLDSDVLPFKPTIATTCYGMNDGGYTAMTKDRGDEYRDKLTKAIEKLKANGVRTIVVGSPGSVDAPTYMVRNGATAEDYNKTLDALRGIAEEIAQKEGVPFADVHTPMMEVMKKAHAAYGDSYHFVEGGGVHPNDNGQIVMAYAFLKGLGCDGAIGTITLDLASGDATATPGQKVISSKGGKIELESTRYPFCFDGDPTKGDQMDASVIRFFPFNEDLNRYLLVVKGLKGAKAKVTWGSETKEFSKADLEKGVNLAAEFIPNPFAEQFAKVHKAVQDQQAYETILVKNYLHFVPMFKAAAGPEGAAADQLAAGLIKHDSALFDTVTPLIVPVKHTIQVQDVP